MTYLLCRHNKTCKQSTCGYRFPRERDGRYEDNFIYCKRCYKNVYKRAKILTEFQKQMWFAANK